MAQWTFFEVITSHDDGRTNKHGPCFARVLLKSDVKARNGVFMRKAVLSIKSFSGRGTCHGHDTVALIACRSGVLF